MRFLIVCVLNVLVACILLAQSKTSQKSRLEEVLQSAVVAYEERSLTTPQAFRASLNLSRAPGGMVTISGCQENKLKKSWKPQGQPLGEVLNDIIDTDRNYMWETQDGAINLLPASGEPPLLQTYIGEFSVTTKSSLAALGELQQRPEVKEAMSNLHLKGGLSIISLVVCFFRLFSRRQRKRQTTLRKISCRRKVPGSELEFLSTRNVFNSSLWLTHLPGGNA